MSNKKFLKILLLQILAVSGALVYFFVDSADIYRLFMGDVEFTQAPKECNLHISSCKVNIPDMGEIEFSVSPKPIEVMQTLTFSIKTDIDTNNFKLNIYATNMNMGYHNFELKKVAPNRYEAKGTLPTCTVGGMIWNAEVVNKNRGVIFTFKTR